MLQQIQAHLHLPMEAPDGAALAELKRQDPDAHSMWLRQVEKQMEHQRFMESAIYTMPLKVMKSAHRSALAALVVLTAVTGYALYLDHQWFAAIFGALDVVAILGVFARSSDPSEE
ncbi:hypothetical protein GUY44_12165 [Pimelobacter simplex]|uniref:hypothetical protein n=1 Tax=Nocardioides simplex TaxID=2045 RepID=UPI00114273E9|nr:hypothetical protein [Pimelobacter simplex]MCG8151238.1 hypothetical protein [Pimelobacter simplex]